MKEWYLPEIMKSYKYGHIIYHFKVNFMLIKNRNRTWV